MIVDIENELLTILKNNLSVPVLTEYPDTTPDLPCVIFFESDNVSDEATIDSAGEKYNNVYFEINIFTEGRTKKSTSKALRDEIDDILVGTYKLTRNYSNRVPNYSDNNIFRYVLRYGCKVDENRTIYRR